MSESEPGTPATADDYAAAIQGRSDGGFTSRLREDVRTVFATIYGAPFFAIHRLAPELRNKPNLNLIVADSGDWYSAVGGRWLTLYAKAQQPPRKLSITVCAARRPRYDRPPKPILFQTPQQVLTKAWDKHLRSLDTPPDLTIVPVPEGFEKIEAMIEALVVSTPGHKTLLAHQSKMETLIVAALLRAHGFEISEAVGFDRREGEPQHLAAGAWWLSAIAPEKANVVQPVEKMVEPLRMAYRCLRGVLQKAADKDEAIQIAATIATRVVSSVEQKDVTAVLTPPSGGIALDTGRHFKLHGGGNVWRGAGLAVSAELLNEVPKPRDQITPDADRLNVMVWIGKALAEDGRRRENIDAAPVAAVELQESRGAPQVAEPDVSPATEPNDPTHSESTESTAPPGSPRPQRSRLPRSAGTVNVLALAARLGKVGQKQDDAFDSAKSHFFAWLKDKGFTEVQPNRNSHIELPIGEVSIETDGKSVWSIRFDDRQQMEEGAFWRVEATLLGLPEPALGLRLFQIRRTEDARDPVSGAPRVVANIAREVGLYDAGIPLQSTALRISDEKGATWLINLLLNPSRTQPIIAVSNTESATPDASIERLAARLAGVAHVICIGPAVSERMIRSFGRDRSLFGNAIRLYRPGFTQTSDPFLHRIWTPRERQLPTWMADDISEEVCAISLEVGDVDERVPSFHAIRNLLSERRLETLRRQSQSISSTAEEEKNRQEGVRIELESALAKYKSQSQELAALVRELEIDLRATRKERDSALDDTRKLKHQLDNRWALDDVQDVEIEDESHYPETWEDLETWVNLYGDNKLVLLPQAVKAAQESSFRDIPFAYKALEYLVRHYVPMRTRSNGDDEIKRNHDLALADLGLDLSPVGTAADERRYKAEYRRQHEGRKVKLDMHLKKGAGFDPTAIFRLYFHYDPDTATVIVGHLPTHLTNRTTHSG